MKMKNEIVIHLLFWSLFAIFPEIGFFLSKDNFTDEHLFFALYTIGISVINFYLFYLFIMPFIFKPKMRVASILATIIFVVVFIVIRYYMHLGMIHLFDNIHWLRRFSPTRMIYRASFDTLVYTANAIFVKFTIDWFYHRQLKNELITQNQTSELALLRTQVNPHFLFNTLNNIYSLVYKKSEDAPTAVMKLSEIMRYMLYDANADKVLLEKEVEYIKSFIELNLLRLKDKNFVECKVTGNIHGYLIAPMLLIPFVENAFKHGNKKVSSPGIIILIAVEKQKIMFEITNFLSKDKTVNKDESGGIGLMNIKRRLELLYPKKHDLLIQHEEERYYVKLELLQN